MRGSWSGARELADRGVRFSSAAVVVAAFSSKEAAHDAALEAERIGSSK